MSKLATIYVVLRRDWDAGCQHEFGEEHSGVPVRAFATGEEAEAFRLQLEEEARQDVSPFPTSNWPADYASRSEATLLKRLRALKLPSPQQQKSYGYKYLDWSGWWNAHAGDLSDAQRAAVWDFFDRLHFYLIAETELEG